MKSDEKDKGKEDLSRTAGLPLIYSNAMDRDTLIAASRSRCSVDREDGIARGRERRGWALEMGSHGAPPSANGGRRRLHTWYMYLTSQPTTPVSYKIFIDSSAHTGRRHAAHHRALILLIHFCQRLSLFSWARGASAFMEILLPPTCTSYLVVFR